MIFYKTVSLHPAIEEETFTVDGVIFTVIPCSDEQYPNKVIVANEDLETLNKLQNTEGVIILTESEFNAL